MHPTKSRILSFAPFLAGLLLMAPAGIVRAEGLRDLPADSTAALSQAFASPRPAGTLRVLLAGSGDHHHFPRFFLADDAAALRAFGSPIRDAPETQGARGSDVSPRLPVQV